MDYKIDRVEAVRSTSKIVAARPVTSFDSLLQQQSNPKKQRVNRLLADKRRPGKKKKETGDNNENRIDCNI